MKRHIDLVHENKKKPFKCEICDYSCTLKGNMKIHIESVHYGKKPFICHICEKGFATKQRMTKHVTSVHEYKKQL